MVYGFLRTPRWLGLAALALALAAVMVLAGQWQFDRYRERSAINARIDAATTATPTPVGAALPAPPRTPGTAGPPPPAAAQWSLVTMTGRYDRGHEILARGRTVGGRVGFEVLTPLVLADGSAVLVDRGWLAPATGDATSRPPVPPTPTGVVTVAGRVAPPEARRGGVDRRDGRLEVRRIAPAQLATALPYPIFGGYVLLDEGQPGAAPELAAVPSPRARAWQNAGYAVQWWLFAVLTLVGYGWLARREAHGPPSAGPGDRVDAATAATSR